MKMLKKLVLCFCHNQMKLLSSMTSNRYSCDTPALSGKEELSRKKIYVDRKLLQRAILTVFFKLTLSWDP